MIRARRFVTMVVTVSLAVAADSVEGQSLRGSASSLDLQNRIAAQHDFTYIATGNQLRRFVDSGYLVPVRPNSNFELSGVTYPYTRPEVALFIDRLSRQYRAACGEKLVVTSLTRPQNQQPPNASSRSVHPTGMALDLRHRVPSRCRAWLESVLTSLEEQRVLEATRERVPAHYHVAIFPDQYSAYVEQLTDREVDLPGPEAITAPGSEYRVRRGDSLWSIAERHGTTVERLRGQNDLSSSRIYVGQTLQIPARDR